MINFTGRFQIWNIFFWIVNFISCNKIFCHYFLINLNDFIKYIISKYISYLIKLNQILNHILFKQNDEIYTLQNNNCKNFIEFRLIVQFKSKKKKKMFWFHTITITINKTASKTNSMFLLSCNKIPQLLKYVDTEIIWHNSLTESSSSEKANLNVGR